MTLDQFRRDLATTWIPATETIKTRDDNVPALTWLENEKARFERRTGRGTMLVIRRGAGTTLQYALAYAGLFGGENGETEVEE